MVLNLVCEVKIADSALFTRFLIKLHDTLIEIFYLFIFFVGPSRQELKYMAEYKKQTESQPSEQPQQQQQKQQPPPPPPQQQSSSPPSSSSSSMGMMRMPGRGSRKSKYGGLDLGSGGLSDTTFEAAVLGELAVISIESPEVDLPSVACAMCV